VHIAEWLWDDNVEHIARHGIAPGDVDDIPRNDPKFRRNRKARAATHQMIGPDAVGGFVAVFLAPVPGVAGLWRVITARPASEPERRWWETS